MAKWRMAEYMNETSDTDPYTSPEFHGERIRKLEQLTEPRFHGVRYDQGPGVLYVEFPPDPPESAKILEWTSLDWGGRAEHTMPLASFMAGTVLIRADEKAENQHFSDKQAGACIEFNTRIVYRLPFREWTLDFSFVLNWLHLYMERNS